VTPPKLEAIAERREALARQLATMRAMPLPEAPPGATGKRDPAAAWRREVDSLERLIARIDQLIARAAPRRARGAPPPADGGPPPTASLDLARIPKGRRAEMRVSVKEWKGRRTVDIRLWFIPQGGTEYVASRKGVSVDAGKLPALLDALHLAVQHSPCRPSEDARLGS
jgi:hypothetical protein